MSNNKDFQQSSDLKSIGLILKKKREELSYTLEHVSEITRITLTCLRNIEEGNMKALPGLVFVRGFIRNYAKLLGLESDWMIEALNQNYTSGSESPTPVGETTHSQDDDPDQPKSNLFLYAAGVVGVLVILLVVYVVYQKPSDQLSLNNQSVETVQAVAPLEEATEAAQTDAGKGHETGASNAETAQAVAPIISPLTLTLVALENDWIRLSIDGQDPFKLKLKKGEKYEWPAEEEYALILSTGHSATVHLNGEEIVERESFLDQLYQVKLNKFTLKQINNR